MTPLQRQPAGSPVGGPSADSMHTEPTTGAITDPTPLVRLERTESDRPTTLRPSSIIREADPIVREGRPEFVGIDDFFDNTEPNCPTEHVILRLTAFSPTPRIRAQRPPFCDVGSGSLGDAPRRGPGGPGEGNPSVDYPVGPPELSGSFRSAAVRRACEGLRRTDVSGPGLTHPAEDARSYRRWASAHGFIYVAARAGRTRGFVMGHWSDYVPGTGWAHRHCRICRRTWRNPGESPRSTTDGSHEASSPRADRRARQRPRRPR